MIKKFTIYTILAGILFLAALLRFYQLALVPPSPSLDEVSLGYNAYSILKTGADEYGTKFPILLRAYDDWRPALYVYLAIPFVKFLGLNVLAVRLPSVILSVLTVLATYFLVKELFTYIPPRRCFLPLVATFFLAISPWHIYLSRLGHEVNASLAFVVFATLSFLKAINYDTAQYHSRRLSFLGLSAIFFALSLYTYQSIKIFAPLTVLLLAIIFWRQLLTMKKELLLSFIVGLLLLIPILKVSLTPQALIRFQGTNAFTAQSERFTKEAKLFANAVGNNNIWGRIVHNRRMITTQIFTEGYFSHFNPRWLFTNTGDDRHKVPNLGLFYIWEAPLILLGLYFLVKSKFDRKIATLIFAWVIISPIPAAITTDAPHAMRSFTLLPMLSTLSALGAIFLMSIFKKITKLLWLTFGGVVLVSLYLFYQNYFLVFPQTQSKSFQYALAQAVPYVWQISGQYEKIVFSNRDELYQAYMFFLFFTKYDPKIYQEHGGTGSGGFAETHQFGKYEFRSIDWGKEKKDPKILYVGTPQELPTNILKTFYYLDGKEGVRIVKG